MRPAVLPLLCALVAGCAPASDYRPKVDLTGVDTARYEIDLSDCKKVAERDRYGPVLAGALVGAGLGTAGAAAMAGVASTGNIGLAESYGAITGTVAGTAFGASQMRAPGDEDENRFVDACLRNNGYKILE
jgi:outer membrane lipoprotein SlyB